MLRHEKDAVIAEVQQLLTDTENVFVSDYRGLTVAELAELRGKLRESGAQFKIVKNTLGGIAADKAGREPVKELLTGPTGVTFCGDDMVGAAKALADFAKTHPQLEVRGGLLDASLIDAAGVKALASLPPREVLIAQLVGTMAAPMSGLVTVLQGTVSGFVRALDQVAQQRAAAGEA
ncbi:MAG TPA: 50S ribosomal protein L10 [Thermoleophilia bacterium]|nr:50S ribosomal protein L10 [Thermoleophilia bacterium]